MSINGIGPRIPGIGMPRVADEEKRPGGHSASGQSARSATDRVEISEAGRKASELSPELQEIRDKVESGAYDSPAIAEVVARRILASGDLGQD